MGIIISVINNKGGVGKTTIACNLGAALARMKKQVLLVDDDPQTNATTSLLRSNGDRRNTLYNILDQNDSSPPIQECIYPSQHQEGLYCLPNIRATSGLEMDLIAKFPASLTILREQLLPYVDGKYDFTIIDTPPNIGIMTTIALCASHFVIVPIDASSSDSLDGLQEALNLIESVRETDNPDLRFLRLLINRVHGHKTICKIIVSDIEQRFEADLRFTNTIPENTALQQATYMKETIFKSNSTSRAATAFRKLGKELLSILDLE